MTSLFLPSSQPIPASKDYLVATNVNTAVFVCRSDVTFYEDLVTFLAGLFPGTNLRTIFVQMNELDICAGCYTDIPLDLWPDISPQIRNVKIISRSQSLSIHVETPSGAIRNVSLPSSASIYSLKIAIHNLEGMPIDRQLLMYRGESLWNLDILWRIGISDEATVSRQLIEAAIPMDRLLWGGLQGGGGMRKLVIYLFSLSPIHSTMRVSLVDLWTFSAVYPSVLIKDTELGQSVLWDVYTHEDHSLTTGTGTRVSYLFWEAEQVEQRFLFLSLYTYSGHRPKHIVSPPSPSPSPRNVVVPFDPSCPQVNSENSVVLCSSQAAEYLDKALSALCLHVDARTSFITYWLSDILKHDYVALHFLPQASYEHTVPLEVEPKPDIVTCVFMLFTRVCEDELVEWEGAFTRAFENVDIWKGIVGVDGHKMKDERLFRVLEWGGMEVGH
ncbi:hypothetical protein IW261DRAFT_1683640 [Armillaria novae-zelandiae]|uniref:Ubiquitin-like domain-containing protein n=1 Tax=Armillaria novae-zelandiae TaxID=153914 RepID=A0AA39NJ36_9AGAR|nr:hypothetical protein IW261DRAFT_1683640 [Armillaria novae-zelandiae]